MKKLIVLCVLGAAMVACGGDAPKPVDPSSTTTTSDPTKTDVGKPSTPATSTPSAPSTPSTPSTPDPTKK